VFREMRRGDHDEAQLEHQLNSRGLMNRFLGRFTKTITKPWKMYPLGILFGLGFDTASEVALLFLAAGAAGVGLPFYAILCLPILCAAGMSLLDTIDGSFMNFAYGWAFSKPVRKVFYNIAVTGLSVAVALVIGTIERAIALEQLGRAAQELADSLPSAAPVSAVAVCASAESAETKSERSSRALSHSSAKSASICASTFSKTRSARTGAASQTRTCSPGWLPVCSRGRLCAPRLTRRGVVHRRHRDALPLATSHHHAVVSLPSV